MATIHFSPSVPSGGWSESMIDLLARVDKGYAIATRSGQPETLKVTRLRPMIKHGLVDSDGTLENPKNYRLNPIGKKVLAAAVRSGFSKKDSLSHPSGPQNCPPLSDDLRAKITKLVRG